MRKAKVISETLLSLVKEAQEEKRHLLKRLIELNDLTSAINHELELTRLNVVQAYKVTAYLQEVLRERRQVKCELNTLDVLLNSLASHNITSSVRKIDAKISEYVNRENGLVEDRGLLKSILGAKKLATL